MHHLSLFILSDVDECVEGTHDCHDNADCYDIIGSFVCMCSAGYSGDGVENCTGKKVFIPSMLCAYICCVLVCVFQVFNSNVFIPRH